MIGHCYRDWIECKIRVVCQLWLISVIVHSVRFLCYVYVENKFCRVYSVDIKEGALLENKSPSLVSRWKMSQNLDWIFGNVPGNGASLVLYLQLVSVYKKPRSRNTCSSKPRCLLLVSSLSTKVVILRHVLCKDVKSATWCWTARY